MISFDVDGLFNYAPNTYCPNDGIIDTYATVLEATGACSNDGQCDAVVDFKCDGPPFHTCQGTVKTSTKGSCTWEKIGT